MNKTHILTNLANDQATFPTDTFPPQSKLTVDYFFSWVCYLFYKKRDKVGITVNDGLPSDLRFKSDGCALQPYPTYEYTKIILEVAQIFDAHTCFSARINEEGIIFQFIPPEKK